MDAFELRYRWLAVGVLAVGLGGCGTFGWVNDKPPPQHLSMLIQASLDTNRNIYGRPSPVVVRVFQMANSKAFERAELFQLHADAEKVMGGDLLGEERFLLRPGQTQHYRFIPAQGMHHIGLIAEFRDVDEAQWRAVTKLDLPQTSELVVSIERKSIELTVYPSQEQETDE